MQAEKTHQGLKLLIILMIGLTGVFMILVALASSNTRSWRETAALSLLAVQDRGAAQPDSESSPKFLEDFVLVPGSAVLLDDHHVLALYKKDNKEFYAMLLFSVDCDTNSCTPIELLAFSIVDGQGQDIQLA
jgi:hypothetical protein